MYSEPADVLISELDEGNQFHQFWWTGRPGTRGARVITTDELGRVWTLEVKTEHVVTQKVAAGLLCLSLMTVNKWVREGVFGQPQWLNNVSVVPLQAVEEIAMQRGELSR